MKYGMFAVVLAMLASSVSMAEGRPSKGKLDKLGLGSMQVVSDEAGQQVRGKAFFKLIASWQAAAGEKAVVNDNGTGTVTVVIDPAAFVAHDFNTGSLIVTDGLPLGNGALAFALPIGIGNTADAFHQQDILIGGGLNFSEISASTNSFAFSLFAPIP